MFKRHRKLFVGLGVVFLSALIALSGISIYFNPNDVDEHSQVLTIGQDEIVFKIGMAKAATVTDYTCDGTADDVQFQAALDALPTTGGKIEVLGGNYNFTTTVLRAIDNVTIEGVGQGAYFAYNGASPIFSAGSKDGWVFKDFATDAGGVNVASATNYIINNVWVGTDCIGKTVRTATVVVAASDATDSEKAQADIVCDGTNDEDDIMAADALAAGGLVRLSTGTFSIDNDLTLDDYSTIQGCGIDTKLVLDGGDAVSVIVEGLLTFEYGNRLWDVEIVTDDNTYTGEAVIVYPELVAGTHCSIVDLLKNVTVVNGAKATGATCGQTGKGIVLRSTAGRSLSSSSFNGLKIYGFEYGLYIDASSSDVSPSCYITANMINEVLILKSVYHIYIVVSGTQNPIIQGNHFNQIVLQYYNAVTAGIYLNENSTSGHIELNQFDQLFFWDWPSSDQIYATGTSYNNYFRGYFSTSRLAGASAKLNVYEPMGLGYGQLGEQQFQYPYYNTYSVGLWVLGTAGESITAGQLCRWDASDSEWYGTDADALATTEGILGICMSSSLSDGGLGRFLLRGVNKKETHGFVDEPIVVSETKFGICGVDELGTSSFMRVVGYPLDGDNWFFNPSPDIFELDGAGAICAINGLSIDDGD